MSRKGPPGIPAAGTKTIPAEEVKGKGREPGQFKYQSLAEDKELIQAVIDRLMESQVTMLQKELLVISPDVRQHMKEVITLKRVIQNTVEALLAMVEVQAIGVNEQKSGAGGMVVGVDCLPLQCINGLVNRKYPVECTLDSGAQLIAMRRAIWTDLSQYLQFPLKPTRMYNMVAADHGRSSTLGTLENVLLKFGDVELYIRVQVVEDALFDILLRQPFFAVAGAQTSHSTSGEQLITLKDPNNGSVVTLATKGKGEGF